MKKVFVFIVCLLLLKTSFSQGNKSADRDFLKAYSSISFTPGVDSKAIIRKWDTDIKIFIESKKNEYYQGQVNNIIQKINPYLTTIKMSLTDNKGDANCVIKIDSINRTHYEVNWENNGTIYKSIIYINTEKVFNDVEQINYLSEYLMIILGDFHLPRKINSLLALRLHIDQDMTEEKNFDAIQSILKSRSNGFTEFDFKVMKLHYSKDVKAGIDKRDLNEIVKKKLRIEELGS